MHTDDRAKPGLNPEEVKKSAEHYFGPDGITLDAIKRFLADSGSPPLPDVGKLLQLAIDLPHSEELGKGWERLLNSDDLGALIDDPKACTDKHGIDSDVIKSRLEAFQRRLDDMGPIQFPDPSMIAQLLLTMADHLTDNMKETPKMTDLAETIQRNEDLIGQNEALLSQTDRLLSEHSQLLEQHGLTPEAVRRFIESDAVSPEDREHIRQELAKAQEEMTAREAQIETEQALNAKTSYTKKPKMRSMV
ncbi:hypothetical protein [Halochromatium roseum]|uniref:hypothetical protein n=1 Tax=Halochromatium roseum TaxID=391920 RepID=UPI001912FA1C|nr:hypothetical protein [Halochromatium roseum]